jgi:malate synthase
VLIETILARFEMDEILYELRDHRRASTCGRWDYIFSCIKKFRNRDFILADRAQVTMTSPFMRAYSLQLIKTCHRRGAFAMGGMARRFRSRTTRRNEPPCKSAARQGARSDRRTRRHLGRASGPGRRREGAFRQVMPSRTRSTQRDDVQVKPRTCSRSSRNADHRKRLRININIGIQYLGAWLAGPAACRSTTSWKTPPPQKIARAQIWKWIRSPLGKPR